VARPLGPNFDYDGVVFNADATGVEAELSGAGLMVGETRTIALRVTDCAGAVSSIDTATVVVVSASPLYVNWSATGRNDGSSWEDAFTDLRSALIAAVSGDDIWVAAGVYRPTSGTDRNIAFDLKAGVALYGGFAGTESALDQRNWTTNLTALSGDIGAVGMAADNSYHVINATSIAAATIDGITIAAGQADHSNADEGGGLYSYCSSLTLNNVSFSGNFAGGCGGGLYNYAGTPKLTNVSFFDNTANDGAGIYTCNGSPTLANVTLSENTAADRGGGVTVSGSCSATLNKVSFSGNNAGSRGGGPGRGRQCPSCI
jgi:hypothetical protein